MSRSHGEETTWGQLVFTVVAMVVILGGLAICNSSTDIDDRALGVLDAAGFSQVELEGIAWLSCGEHDTFSRKFSATNPRGRRVSGVVCCGYSKMCTVRF